MRERWPTALAIVVAVTAGACVQSQSVLCPSGVVCPIGSTCGPRGGCLDPVRLAACEGKLDRELCTIEQANDGSCDAGSCVPLVCGNGVEQPGELCDDGNRLDNDGCRSDCASNEQCGNGLTDFQRGEQCDCGTDAGALPPGCTGVNSATGGFCRADCRLHCGDGEVRGLETCDGAAPTGASCSDFGYDLGHVGCSPVCSADLGSCVRIGWEPIAAVSSNAGLIDIWAISPTEAFAVESAGTLFHLDGANVTSISTGLTNVGGVWAAAANDVFVVGSVGNNGAAVRYDGTTVSPMTMPLVANLTAVWGRAPDDVWAITPYDVLHYDGSSWTEEVLPVAIGRTLKDLWGTQDEILVVGEASIGSQVGGHVLRKTAAGWQVMANPPLDPLEVVWASSPTNVWASSRLGRVHQFDGSWTQALDLGTGIFDIVGTGPDSVYVSQGAVAMWRWDGRAWLRSIPQLEVQQLAMVDGSHLFAVGSKRVHRSAAYAWAPVTFAETQAALANAYGTSTANVYALSIDPPGLQHWDGRTWTEISIPYNDVSEIWAESPTRIVVTGNAGLFEYDGTWSFVSSVPALLRSLWGTSLQGLFAVGDQGAIFRRGATSWTSMTSPTTQDLYDVWGRNSSDVFAVGANGTIVHYDGNQWTPMTSGVTATLRSISGSATYVYAVGDGGTIVRFDGTTWMQMPSGVSTRLSSVSAVSDTDVFAVGEGNVILHDDGQGWMTVRSPVFTANWATVFAQPSAVLLLSDDGYGTWLVRPTP